jgi:hypothetical protein
LAIAVSWALAAMRVAFGSGSVSSLVSPTLMASPGFSGVGSLMRRPLTKVPFVDPRSSMTS